MKFISAVARASLAVALAAAVTTKVASSSGTVAADSMPNPWLALLTSSWSLAGKPEKEKSQGLQSLADSIVQLAKSGNLEHPDETMQSAIDSIKEIVVDMKESINASNEAAQQTLNEKRAALDNCTEPATTDKATWTAGLSPTEAEVISCRSEERQLKANYTACYDEQQRCAHTTECCHALLQPNAYCLPVGGSSPQPSTLESQCSGRSKCKLNDLDAMLTYFQGKRKEYTDAQDACTASRAGCDDNLDCEPKKTTWETKAGTCNSLQADFEQQYCNLAVTVESQWETYSNCYDTADAALKAEEQKQRAILPGRHQEWRGVLRIECLLGALQAENITQELETCIDTSYGEDHWAHLDLTYPSEQADYPTKATCSEDLETPGADHFKTTHYSDVIDMIPADLSSYHCVASVSTEHCARDTGVGTLLLAKKMRVSKPQHLHRRPQHAKTASRPQHVSTANKHHGLKHRKA